jgi:predicted GNAT superfamily acetyltransferase
VAALLPRPARRFPIQSTIRRAQPADAPAILAINRAGQPGVFRLGDETITQILRDAALFLVATSTGAVVGYLIGYDADGPSAGEEFEWFRARHAPFLYVDQIAVAPAARRSHVASGLYEAATTWAEAQELPLLVCEVNLAPANPVSIAFHRRHGFEELAVLTTADGRTVSLMRREIVRR